jgi:hypothetical protein
MEPYGGADYKLTLPHSQLLSTVSFHPSDGADEIFPSCSKMEQPIGKGRV